VLPNYPIYIPSKGRWQHNRRLTTRTLDALGVPYRVIVEEQEFEQYAAEIGSERLLVLDSAYQRDYDTLDTLGDTKSRGPGPARNFAWDHSISEGAKWHWVMDDNISKFTRLNHNARITLRDPVFFRAMEDFCERYTNLGMAGPNYRFFVTNREQRPPFILNSRIYSCNLIRNDVPFRWRGRYNEDTILSLDMMKAGWNTVLFNAFLQDKIATQILRGGCTDEFYAKEGTLAKSEMQVKAHPDVSRLVWKFNRWHHYVDYSKFKYRALKRKPGLIIPQEPNEYGLKLTQVR